MDVYLFGLAYFASGIGHASIFGNRVKSPKTFILIHQPTIEPAS